MLGAACWVLALTVVAAQQTTTDVRVDRAVLMSDLRTLAGDAMEGREVGTAGGRRARDFVAGRFKAIGLQSFGGSYLHTFPLPRRGAESSGTGANVVGFVRGASGPDRYVIVSAHYDHVGVRNGEVFNGANDNASGTAALFAVAEHFARRPGRSSVLFVAFDGEETGLWGSRAFVRALPVDRTAIIVNLNLDMIARDARRTLYVAGTSRFPLLRPTVERARVSPALRLAFGHDNLQTRSDDWTRDSDQWAFIEAGIPALYIGVEDYANHHKPTDDVETVMEDFYVGAVETIARIVDEFAR